MYQEKDIKQGKESEKALLEALDLLSIVEKTLGPKGRNIIFTDMYGGIRISNDGVSILRQIFSKDETVQMYIDAVKQAAIRTNMQSGDASTTFVTLVKAIIKAGLKSKRHPLKKRDEINGQVIEVLEKLKSMAIPVETYEDLKNVATVAVENEEIGSLIAEATLKVGKEGKVDVQESEISGTRVEYINGFEIGEGYIAEFMMNNERGEAILENPYILIVDTKISNIKDLLPILQKLADAGTTQCLVVCDGMDGNMLPTIALNKRQRYLEGKNVMEIIGVKFPAVRKPEFIEDIALITNGKVMGMTTGLFPDKADIKDLGRCSKVVVTAKKTTFIGGKGDVSEKIETIKNLRDSSEINKEAYNDRIAGLKGEVAVLKVGAASGVDLGYLKDKIEDAVYSTKGAYEEGAVRGGGLALKEISEKLPKGILKTALQAPYNQIQVNAGRKRTWYGRYKNSFPIKDNIYDSVKSTRIVVENACSFAGSSLTTAASIATVRVKQDK